MSTAARQSFIFGIVAASLVLFTIPFIASALTIEDIKAQAQSILERIQVLKTQLQNDGTGSTYATSALPTGLPCLSLARAISIGSSGL